MTTRKPSDKMTDTPTPSSTSVEAGSCNVRTVNFGPSFAYTSPAGLSTLDIVAEDSASAAVRLGVMACEASVRAGVTNAAITNIVYIVEQSSSSAGPWVPVPGSPVTGLNTTVTGLQTDTTYWFRITAQVTSLAVKSSPIIVGPITTTGVGTGDPMGTQAHRIADMLEGFGFNTYPMSAFPGTNVYGCQASNDYTAASVIRAYGWLTANAVGTLFGSGLTMLQRVWTYQPALGELDLASWCQTVAQATGCKYSMVAGGAPGSHDSIRYQITQANNSHNGVSGWTSLARNSIAYVENYNEPNGIGGETAAQVTTAQAEYAGFTGATVAGPSIVIGLPVPDGYISGYLGSDAAKVAANSSVWNVHFYPPYNPDFDDSSGRGGMFNDVYQGTNTGYGATKPQIITEWHPTLRNHSGNSVVQAYDAYYAPMFILSAFRLGYLGYIWWSLYDFDNAGFAGTGLWPGSALTDTPRQTAYVLRAMYSLTGDMGGAVKHTFAPGKINYAVSGLPPPASGSPNSGGQTMLFQNSTGKFFLFVWNSQETPGGGAVPVVIDFNSHAMRNVTEYNLANVNSTSPAMVQSINSCSSIMVSLAAEVHLLVITY
jgi:hypothetical protein